MSAAARPRTARGGHLSETGDVTLHTLAVIGHTAVAEQRRKALRAYAGQARPGTRRSPRSSGWCSPPGTTGRTPAT